MRQVFRTAIPVDDTWHTVVLSGPILHVATRFEDQVEIWHLHNPGLVEFPRTFRVFGTGHHIDEDAGKHIGTAITPNDGRFVWHLFERRPA